MRTSFCQCELRRGNMTMVSFLPQKFAVKGKYIELQMANDSWENGWKVESVGYVRTFEETTQFQSDHKKQRKASDV